MAKNDWYLFPAIPLGWLETLAGLPGVTQVGQKGFWAGLHLQPNVAGLVEAGSGVVDPGYNRHERHAMSF